MLGLSVLLRLGTSPKDHLYVVVSEPNADGKVLMACLCTYHTDTSKNFPIIEGGVVLGDPEIIAFKTDHSVESHIDVAWTQLVGSSVSSVQNDTKRFKGIAKSWYIRACRQALADHCWWPEDKSVMDEIVRCRDIWLANGEIDQWPN